MTKKTRQPIWMHRPSADEHEEVLKAMREGDYPSISAFVREGVLRLVYADNKRPLFSRLSNAAKSIEEVIEELSAVEEG